jgi:hypothetical protein
MSTDSRKLKSNQNVSLKHAHMNVRSGLGLTKSRISNFQRHQQNLVGDGTEICKANIPLDTREHRAGGDGGS